MRAAMMKTLKFGLNHIFKNSPIFQEKPLKIVNNDVNIDSKIQRILLNHFISTTYKK